MQGTEFWRPFFLGLSILSCVWLFIHDWRTNTLPITALTLLGLGLGGYYWQNLSLEGLLLCSLTTATLWLLAKSVGHVKGTNVLGGGDLLLVFLLSCGLTFHQIPWFFALSGLLALIYWRLTPAHAKGDSRLPFAPALITARWILGGFAT
ncbi:MAG: prepilin peptidase [Holosporales bacterium]